MRPSACRLALLRRQRRNPHNTLHSTTRHGPRDRFAERTTTRTSCNILRSPRTDACTWHAPSSHLRRVTRSDGSRHHTALGNPRRSRRTSSGDRRADYPPRTRSRSLRAGRRRWYSMTSFGSSWSWSFVSQHAGVHRSDKPPCITGLANQRFHLVPVRSSSNHCKSDRGTNTPITHNTGGCLSADDDSFLGRVGAPIEGPPQSPIGVHWS
jgi:hypothetical protein